MKNKKAYELAESFVNGNITYIVENTRKKSSFLAVLRVLEENYSAEITDDFVRIVGKY